MLLIEVESVYFHCAQASARSKLWDPACHVERYEADLAERMKKSLY